VAALGEGVPEGAPAGVAWWVSSHRPEAQVEALKAAGAEVVWRAHQEASAEDCRMDRGVALEWLLARKRKGRERGNVVTLSGASGSKVRLWFGPRDTDFAKPVRVVANGRTAFEGALSPSFDVFLERLAATGDARSTAWARLEVVME
jgi:hypothetical protein